MSTNKSFLKYAFVFREMKNFYFCMLYACIQCIDLESGVKQVASLVKSDPA